MDDLRKSDEPKCECGLEGCICDGNTEVEPLEEEKEVSLDKVLEVFDDDENYGCFDKTRKALEQLGDKQ